MDPQLSLPSAADRRPAPELPRVKAGASPEAITRTAKDFEAMVVGELIAPMFEALDTDGLGGGGSGEKMFRPMLVREYAKSLVATGGIGLADDVAREMIRMQTMETTNAAAR